MTRARSIHWPTRCALLLRVVNGYARLAFLGSRYRTQVDMSWSAIAAASTPNYLRMLSDSPHALLATSGRAVGLPTGQMGNSEVGHMNIGAGRVVAQDLPRIDLAIEDGSFASRPALLDVIAKARATKGAVHVMGFCRRAACTAIRIRSLLWCAC